MIKSQQCAVCHGMFASNQGKHESHQKGPNTTVKRTAQKWVCSNCSQPEVTTKKKNK